MMVYGDPQLEVTPAGVAASLGARLGDVERDGIDSLRTALIQAGQLEQGLADAEACSKWPAVHESVQRITDLIAAAFYEASLSKDAAEGSLSDFISNKVALARSELQNWVKGLSNHSASSADLVLKVPEGFEFYALFPEQYLASACAWLKDHASCGTGHALVIGIRAIGTTLSALVGAVLRAAGWQTTRLTVRPTGHPFARTVTIPAWAMVPSGEALVV